MSRRALGGTAVIAVLVIAAALAGAQDLTHLLADARYDDVRTALESADEAPTSGIGRFSAARVATRTADALALLATDELTDDPDLVAVVLDRAGILLGAGRYQESLTTLQPLLDAPPESGIGQAHLMAGLALRAAGDDKSAERMLATVRPGDPAFAAARTALGDLGLAHGDAHLALRYYDAAGGGRAYAGRWRAYRLLGEDADADAIFSDLQQDHADGIALLEIRHLRGAEEEAAQARLAAVITSADSTTVTAPAVPGGRYTLQVGAYRDRRLALDVVRRFRTLVPEMRIDEGRDDRGQALFKVRSGYYMNPALARSEATALQRRLDVDVFVAELDR